jgi:hypothetical protein
MSDRWLTFNPVFSPVGLLAAILLCGLFFSWLERARTLPYVSVRYAALGIMMISLLAILLRPMYKSSQDKSAILLTPGYQQERVDSLLDAHPDAALIHTPETNPYRNSRVVSAQHLLSDNDIQFIVGEGLSASAMDLIVPGSYTYIPAPFPSGIIRIAASPAVIAKRENYIEGIFNHADVNTKVYLDGPGGREDSVVLKGQQNEFFRLRFKPKQSGNFLYSLTDGKSLKEEFPVQVKDDIPMDILVIQHYPTFESQYLKKYLSAHHRLLVRSQLSRNKFRYEFLNRKPLQISRLNEEQLLDFDMMILDSDAYASLSSDEIKQLQRAVEDGLGVLISLNEPPANNKRLNSLLPVDFKTYTADTAMFVIGSKKITLSSWPLRPSVDRRIIPILKNKNRILSGYFHHGLGKAGFQLLQQTYQLHLEGDSVSYSELWSNVIGSLAKTERKSFDLSPGTFPFFEDEPFPVEIISGGDVPSASCDDTPVSLSEDLFIDDVWHGKIWAGKPGWHTLSLKQDSSKFDYYVSHGGDWKSVAITNQIERTAIQSGSSTVRNQFRELFKPIPEWIFFSIFLLGAAVLWLIPKL